MTLATSLALFGAIALGGPAAAQGWDGVYELDKCSGNPGSDVRIEVRGDTIQFYETSCTLTAATPVRDLGDATLFDAVCQGEGETWTKRILMMTGPDGELVMLRDQTGLIYARCD